MRKRRKRWGRGGRAALLRALSAAFLPGLWEQGSILPPPRYLLRLYSVDISLDSYQHQPWVPPARNMELVAWRESFYCWNSWCDDPSFSFNKISRFQLLWKMSSFLSLVSSSCHHSSLTFASSLLHSFSLLVSLPSSFSFICFWILGWWSWERS